ncbi:helix-turn-helix domain-containing protein [Baekduia sp. Peel2402]|uniref:helix-turn-helix domain-containing protein n=1 Tax=Baekduia sp. Peel2402 TaxID=3458296 RepID=UPI00403ED62A
MSALPRLDDPARLQELHGRMVEALLDGGGLHAIAELAARVANGRVVVDLARDGLAATGGAGDGTPVRVPIVTGGEVVGTVSFHGEPSASAADALHAAAMATLTYVALLRDEEPRDDTGARLVEAVLDDAPDAAARIAHLTGGSALVALLGEAPTGRIMAALADHAPGAARTIRDGRIYALVPPEVDALALASALHERLGVAAAAVPTAAPRRAATAAAAPPLAAAHAADGAAALRFGLSVASLSAALVADGTVTPDAIARGTWRLLVRDAIRAPGDVLALAGALGPLLDDEGAQAAQQRRTLATYLANDCNMNATAAAMPSHRHTVAYRLERIHELTGLDPLKAEDREQLGVALKARAVAKVTQASAG